MNKLKNHFINQKNYYILAGIILAVFIIWFAIVGVFPFGNKTFAHYDMYHQIVPFFGLIFDAISGRSTLTFSNFLGGGASIISYITYFIFSPVYIIVLLAGKSNVLYSIGFAFVAQVIIIALVFLWFINKYFNLPSFYKIVISFSYAFSAYVLFNYTWLTWLFIFALFPILVHNFIKLIKTGKIFGFTFCITAMLYCCYGVGLFSQVIIFILSFLFCWLLVKPEKLKTIISKILISYGIAVLIAFPMILAAFLQTLDSSRVGGLFSSVLSGKLFNNLSYGLSYLLVEPILLMLNFLFIIKFNKKSKLKNFLLVALIICAIPIFIDGITRLLSMGTYFGFNMRYSFVLTFIMHIIAICSIKEIRKESFVKKELKSEKYTQRSIIAWLCIGLCVIAVVLIAVFDSLSGALSNASAFSIVLLCIFIMVLMFLIVIGFSLYKYNRGGISKAFLKTILIIVFVIQNLVNVPLFYYGGLEAPTSVMFLNNQTLNENYENARLKAFDKSFGANIHLLTKFSSYSDFSSNLNKNANAIYSMFGYIHTSNSGQSAGGTVLSDAFLGYEYIYSETPLNHSYLTLINNDKENYLYKNTLALNNAIVVNKNATINKTEDISNNTNQLFNYLGGTGSVMEKFSVSDLISVGDIVIENANIVNNELRLINKSIPAKLKFKFSSEEKIIVYISAKHSKRDCPFIENITTQSESINTEYEEIIDESLYELGVTQNLSLVESEICVEDEFKLDQLTFYKFSYKPVEELLVGLKEQKIEVNFVKDGFNVKLNCEEENKKLVVTNTNLKGYSFLNNGNKTTNSNFYLIELDLVNGENNIVATHSFEYSKIIIIALIVSLVGVVLLILINKLWLKNKTIKNIFFYGSVLLMVGFVLLFYVTPSFICVFRICTFKF